MSPAGQAAIAKVQQEALAMAQAKMAQMGVKVPKASSLENLISSTSSAHLNWTNWSAQPVNQTLKVLKDKTDVELTVTVEQAPQ